jgi:hypothetical protein
MTKSNLESLSSSETEVNPAREVEESTYMNVLDVRKPLVFSISQGSEEQRLLQSGFEFDSFKPRLRSGVFKCISISWLNISFFGDDDRGFLKEGVKDHVMAPLSHIISTSFFSVVESTVYARNTQ